MAMMKIRVTLLFVGLVLVHISTAYDMMFVSTQNGIRYYNLSETDEDGTYIPVKDLDNIVAVDYDPTEGYVYWADVKKSAIYRATLSGSGKEKIVSVQTPSSLALDIDERMIYWTDTGSRNIKRSKTNGKDSDYLVTEDIIKPSSIVLDKRYGKMYWTDLSGTPRIERANLNGQQREILVNSSMGEPSSLTLDQDQDKEILYWVDRKQNQIKSLDLKTKQNKQLSVTDVNSSTMTLYGDFIYWIDSNKKDRNLRKYATSSKNSGTGKVLFSLAAWSFSGLKATKTSSGKDILIIAEKRGIMTLETTGKRTLGKQIELLSGEEPVAIEYSKDKKKIYWINIEDKSLRSANLDGSDMKKMTTVNANKRSGLVIDPTKSQIFWTEKSRKRIKKMDLSENGKTTLVETLELDVPTLDLDTNKFYVYTLELNDTIGRISRFSYNDADATNEELLSNLTYPTSVVLDVPNDRMYWSELGSSTIGIAKLDGTELGTMKAERKIKYMTMFGDFLYWYSAQQTQQHVARINLKTKTGWSIILEEEYKFSDIKIIRDAVDCYTEPCSNGGSCTEVPVGHSCTCTSGFTGTNCETVLRNCDSSPCQNGGTCVPDANGYRCICKPGFGGAICDKVLRNCDSSPCQNGGTCVPDANGYRCTCKPGFGGAICDEVIGSCDSNPCKSGGTCTEDANGYRCTCKMGFIGSKCEIGLVYLALIIPIVLLVALIIFYLKKSSRGKTPQKHDYSHKGYQTRDVIVHPGYNPSYWM